MTEEKTKVAANTAKKGGEVKEHVFFEEKNTETERFGPNELKVFKNAKFVESRKKAVELIESGLYGLDDGDFWVLKRPNKDKTYMVYSGLIISHSGCQKINQELPKEERFDQKYCSSPIEFSYNDKVGMIMEYRDERDGLYEIGEISTGNLKGEYPYAMLLKRTFDRVVLVKSKIRFSGILSESEIDKESDAEDVFDETKKAKPITRSQEKQNVQAELVKGTVTVESNETIEQTSQPLTKTLEESKYHIFNKATKVTENKFMSWLISAPEKFGYSAERALKLLTQYANSSPDEEDKVCATVLLDAYNNGNEAVFEIVEAA